MQKLYVRRTSVPEPIAQPVTHIAQPPYRPTCQWSNTGGSNARLLLKRTSISRASYACVCYLAVLLEASSGLSDSRCFLVFRLPGAIARSPRWGQVGTVCLYFACLEQVPDLRAGVEYFDTTLGHNHNLLIPLSAIIATY